MRIVVDVYPGGRITIAGGPTCLDPEELWNALYARWEIGRADREFPRQASHEDILRGAAKSRELTQGTVRVMAKSGLDTEGEACAQRVKNLLPKIPIADIRAFIEKHGASAMLRRVEAKLGLDAGFLDEAEEELEL